MSALMVFFCVSFGNAGAQDPPLAALDLTSRFVDPSGRILLYSRAGGQVFPWNPLTRDWETSIPIVGSPALLTFVPESGEWWAAFPDKTIRPATPGATGATLRVPEPASTPVALHAVNGRFAYVSFSNLHFIDASGVESARFPHVGTATAALWDSIGERLVVTGSRLRSYAVAPDGSLVASQAKFLEGLGDFAGTTGSNQVAFASGRLLDLRSLDQVARFSAPLAGAVKIGESLLTLRQNGADSLIEIFHPASIKRLPGRLELDGAPLFIENTPAGAVVATVIDDVIRLHLVAEDLSLLHVSAAPAKGAKDFGITSLTATGARFHWTDNSDNETGFRIEGQVAGSGTWIPLGTALANAGTATVDALEAGAVYRFRIVTLSGSFETAGPPLGAVTLPATSTALGGEPYELRAIHADDQSVTLGWRDQSNSETGFRLQRRNLTLASPVVTIDVAANTTTHTDTGLTAGTFYEYRIQALDGDGSGTLSQPLEVTTTLANSFAKPVMDLALVSFLPGEVALSWTDNSTDEVEFIIQRAISGDPLGRREIGRAPRNATGFTDLSPPQGVEFSYFVLTINRPGGAPAFTSQFGPFFIPLEAGQYREIHHEHRGIHYFVFDAPNLVQRYDKASRAWLEPIRLTAPARGFWVDDDGIFTGQGPDLVRIPLTGGAPIPLFTLANGPPASIFATDRWISYRIISTTTQHVYRVFDKFTGQPVVLPDAQQPLIADEFRRALRFTARHPVLDQLVGWNALDDALFTFGISDQGHLPESNQTAKHGGSPRHPRLVLSPDGSRWFASSGKVFSSDDLTLAGDLGFNFTDLAFFPDGRMIALREHMLVSLSADLTVQGRMALDTDGIALSAADNDIIRFTLDPESPVGIQVSVVSPAAFGVPSPDPGLNPTDLDFNPDRLFLTADGTLLMPSRARASVFRWSTVAKDWMPTIHLPSPPRSSDLAVGQNRIYLLGEDQMLRRIDLADPALEAVPLRHVAQGTSQRGWVAWLDEMLVVNDERLTSTDPNGSAKFSRSRLFFNAPVTSTAWHPGLRRFYATNDEGRLLSLGVESDGEIIGSFDTSFNYSVSPFAILQPDHGVLLTSPGSFRSIDTLAESSSLAESIAAAAWDENDIISLTEKDGDAILRRWRFPSYFKSDDGTAINGTPLGIFPVADGWLVVTWILGRPRFTLLDENFHIDHVSPAPLFAPDLLQVSDRTSTSVSVTWRDRLDDESGYRVEYRITGGDAWLPGLHLPADTASGILTSLIPNARYDFRVIAFRNETQSLPSETITTRTLSNDLEPIGEPYDLRLTRSSVDFLTIEWNDNADNESGFRIIRTSTTGSVITYDLPPDTKVFTNSRLAPASRFNYQVQVLGPAGPGELSISLQATTDRFLFPPDSPLDLKVIASEPRVVTLTWQSGLTEDGFIISRAPTSDTERWTELARTGPNSHQFTDETVEPGASYLYRVIAFNREGESPWAVVPATTPTLAAEYLGMSAKDSRFVYFGFRRPNQITRYDLENRSWLAPVSLNWEPTHLVPSSEGLIIVADQRVHLLRPGETTPVAFPRRPDSIHSITAANGRIAIVTNADKRRITWMDPATGADTGGLQLDQSVIAIKTDSVDGSLIVKMEGTWQHFDFPDGEPRAREIESRYRSGSPPGDFAIVGAADSSVLLDSDGSFLERATLKYLGCAGLGPVDSALGPLGYPVVMRADSVLAFDDRLVETGRVSLARKAERVAVDGDSVLVFEGDPLSLQGISILEVPLASFGTPAVAEVPADENPEPTFASSFLTNDGRLGLFYPDEDRVRFWSPTERRWLPSWHLPENAPTAIWSTAEDGLLFGTASRDVRLVLASDPNRLARAVFHTPYPIHGLGSFDGFAFATHASSSARPGSSLLHSLGGDPSQPFVLPETRPTDRAWHAWAPALRRLFTVSPFGPSYREITGAGVTAPPGLISPNQASTGHRDIHLSPDGQKVAFASGQIMDLNLMLLHDLGQEFAAIDWLGTSLVTLAPRGTEGSAVVVRSTVGSVEFTLPLQGAPLGIFSLSADQILVVTSWQASIRYHLLGRDLVPLYDSTPQAPQLTQHPVDVRSDFRQNIAFTVEVEGSQPFSYQWYKNGVVLPGAVGKTLLLENTGSSAEGSYFVRVTNAHGQADSAPASLNHGPVSHQIFQLGSLLISSDSADQLLTAYQADGTRLTNPLSPAQLKPISNQQNGDLVVDRFGRLHVINRGPEESAGVHVSTWDPDTRRWTHRSHEMPKELPPTLDSNLEIAGDFLLTSTRRQNLFTGEVTPYSLTPSPVDFHRFSIAEDGLMHLVDFAGRWLRADPMTGEVVATTQLPAGKGQPIVIAAGRNGEAFVGFANHELRRFSPDGAALRTATFPFGESSLPEMFLDLAYSGQGRLAAATSSRSYLTSNALEGVDTITVPGSLVRNHVAWVPSIEPIRPRIEIPSIPPVVLDGPANFPLVGFHPDPDSELVWSLDSISDPSLFRSLEIDPSTGRLHYEPMPWVSGSARISVSLVDQRGRKQTITFDLGIAPIPAPDLQIVKSFTLNRQTGLFEQRITVTNASAREIAGFDLAISGLSAGVTVNNASTREEGTGLIHHRQALAGGASVNLLVEYFAPVRGTVIDPVVTVALVSAPENDPAAGEAGLAVDRCELLDDGAVLIEFTSLPGALYEVQYSDNAINWKISPVNVRAAANRVQWIDRGPPRTDTPPSGKSSRFYRVRELQNP